MAGRTIDDSLHALDVGLPGTIGTTVRVGKVLLKMILESVVWISFLMNAAVNCLRRKNVVIHWYVFAKKMVVTNVIPITISNVACVNSMR